MSLFTHFYKGGLKNGVGLCSFYLSCFEVCLVSGFQYRLQVTRKDSGVQKPQIATKSVPPTQPQQNLTASSSVAAV